MKLVKVFVYLLQLIGIIFLFSLFSLLLKNIELLGFRQDFLMLFLNLFQLLHRLVIDFLELCFVILRLFWRVQVRWWMKRLIHALSFGSWRDRTCCIRLDGVSYIGPGSWNTRIVHRSVITILQHSDPVWWLLYRHTSSWAWFSPRDASISWRFLQSGSRLLILHHIVRLVGGIEVIRRKLGPAFASNSGISCSPVGRLLPL